MFTINEKTEITPKTAVRYILKHSVQCERYDRLSKYYEGEHDILNRRKKNGSANNRLVCNHAKYITDCTTGYFLGEPIMYSSKSGKDISALTDALTQADSETEDIDLARYSSIFGVSYEMLYFSDDGRIKLASLDPRSAFVVYDDSVEQKPVFGVYYMPVTGADGYKTGYRVYLCTKETVTEFLTTPSFTITKKGSPYKHFFGDVPIIEFYNNWDRQSDFEQVTSLIDAYNVLQSDRVNDKEQFVDSLLVIKGQILGDDAEEESAAYNAIKQYGVMTIDDTGDAKWLTRQFDEQAVDILRRSIESDIHKFSGVPCLSDESFSGNSSGVALKYKLIGFEQMTKIKERYFTEGLKIRLKLMANGLMMVGSQKIDTNDIRIIFTRSLPENELELAQTINLLKGVVDEDRLEEMYLNSVKFNKS